MNQDKDKELPRRPFYMMRHGETRHNARRTVQGLIDEPLNSRGLWQGAIAGRTLAKLEKRPARAICSGLMRSQETAIMAGCSEIVEDERLNERDFGELELKVSYDHIHALERIAEKHAAELPCGLESRDSHSARSVPAVIEQLNAYPADETPLFVTHSGTMQRVLEHIGIWNKRLGNACLLHFEPSDTAPGGWEVREVSLEKGELKHRELGPRVYAPCHVDWYPGRNGAAAGRG